MRRSARFSQDGQYRYLLGRCWGDEMLGGARRFVTWVMLNPSTADAYTDDATIRRCIGFSQRWGFDGLWVVNVYALRSTEPALLRSHPEPVGPANDEWLSWAAAEACQNQTPIVAAWGTLALPERVEQVRRLPGMDRLQALGTPTLDGSPRHPLYLRSDEELTAWPTRRAESGQMERTC